MKRLAWAVVAVLFVATTATGQNTTPRKGEPAPDFELKSLDGRTVKLSDFRGRAVVLNFFATWCQPCTVEIPWWIELQKQYRLQGLEVVGITTGEEPAKKVEKFATELGINYTVVIGTDKVTQS